MGCFTLRSPEASFRATFEKRAIFRVWATFCECGAQSDSESETASKSCYHLLFGSLRSSKMGRSFGVLTAGLHAGNWGVWRGERPPLAGHTALRALRLSHYLRSAGRKWVLVPGTFRVYLEPFSHNRDVLSTRYIIVYHPVENLFGPFDRDVVSYL